MMDDVAIDYIKLTRQCSAILDIFYRMFNIERKRLNSPTLPEPKSDRHDLHVHRVATAISAVKEYGQLGHLGLTTASKVMKRLLTNPMVNDSDILSRSNIAGQNRGGR
jgi:hypothetical protein